MKPIANTRAPRLDYYPSHNWRNFFIILTLFNILGYALYLWPLFLAHSVGGVSDDSGFMAVGLALFGIALYILFPLNVINILSILIYLIRKHPRGKSKILSYIALVASSPMLVIGAVLAWQLLHFNNVI
jgi:hypothetical protein